MKMFKKRDGFTLVELIVVIAILAILAGVAIPAYSGYLTKANDAAVVTDLDALVTACQAANAKTGAISEITVDENGTTVAIKGALDAGFETDFKVFINDSAAALSDADDSDATTNVITLSAAKIDFAGSSYATYGAKWDGSKWVPATA